MSAGRQLSIAGIFAAVLFLAACGSSSEKCKEDSCNYHGTCDDSTGEIVCTCDTGYAGEYCGECDTGYHDEDGECVEDETCAEDSCNYHGTCDDSTGVIVCTCDTGYAGDYCDTCASGYQDNDGDGTCSPDCTTAGLSCPTNAHCDDSTGTAVCVCDTGWRGDDCDECDAGYHDESGACVLDTACLANSCNGHGTCDDSSGAVVCTCATGYTGTYCGECASGYQDNDGDWICEPTCATANLTCPTNAHCEDTSGTAVCVCDTGYYGASCTECAAGYHDESGACVLDTACDTLSCNGHGTCDDTTGEVVCTCDANYTGDYCGECDPGYQDNDFNRTCEPTCATAAYTCSLHGTCDDSSGTATCVCDSGYESTVSDCVNINECVEETDNCSVNATCEDTDGSFTCTCIAGYTGDGVVCSDVNECSEGTDNCSEFATCENTAGGFTCTCLANYEGDGVTCEPIDHCNDGTHNCHPHASCSFTGPGTYSCSCQDGWAGSGVYCERYHCHTVLIFSDGTSEAQTFADEAVYALGMSAVIVIDSGTEFEDLYNEGGFEIVLVDSFSTALPAQVEAAVISWANSGGRLIFAYWNLETNASLQTALGVDTVTYDADRDLYPDLSAMETFFDGVTYPLDLGNIIGDDGDELTVPGAGFIAARLDSTSGPGGIAVTNQNTTIVNGFAPRNATAAVDGDSDGIPDMQEIYQNELMYLCGGPCSTMAYAYSGEVTSFVVPPMVYTLSVEAWGAQGGDNITLTGLGGKGARMRGQFNVATDMLLDIIVGERGHDATSGNAANGSGGGGGGSFIWIDGANTPMLVAGGGGASAIPSPSIPEFPVIPEYYGQPGTWTTFGTGSRSHDRFGDSPGGADGSDGKSVDLSGGKGWYSVRLDPAGDAACAYGGDGGFGGGGGSGCDGVPPYTYDEHTAGGGGGYSGGGAGGTPFIFGGGGGGSFHAAGFNPLQDYGIKEDHGQVELTWCGADTPAIFPASYFPITIAAIMNYGDITFDRYGNLLALGQSNGEIYSISRIDGTINTIGQGLPATTLPAIVYDNTSRIVYLGYGNGSIYTYDPIGGELNFLVDITTSVLRAMESAPANFAPYGGWLIGVTSAGEVIAMNPDSPGTPVTIYDGPNNISDLTFGSDGTLYAVDYTADSVITVTSTGTVSTLQGGFSSPDGITYDRRRNVLYVADSGTDDLYRVSIPPGPSDPTLIGSYDFNGGTGVSGIAFDGVDNVLMHLQGGVIDVHVIP